MREQTIPRTSPAALPARVPASVQGSFADYTIKSRLPAIGQTIAAGSDQRTARHIRRLIEAIGANAPVDCALIRGRSAWWDDMALRAGGTRWLDRPFLEAEFLFYRAIDEIAEGRDLFRPEKRKAARNLLPGFLDDLDRAQASPAPLFSLLHQSIFANDHDLSQTGTLSEGYGQSGERLLHDECAQWCATLDQRPRGTFAIVLDNVGRELTSDFALALHLLESARCERIELHAKSMPMFVSDACRDDIDDALAALADHRHPFARSLGDRVARAIQAGRIRIETPEDWSEGRSYDSLSDGLAADLKARQALLFKGDLNYRRFIGDRTWAWDTPATVATSDVPFAALALRALKSEVLVGVRQEATRAAAALRPAWLTDGYFGIAQIMGTDRSLDGTTCP